MVATTNGDSARGRGRRQRATLRSAVTAFLGRLGAERQLAANRRLMEELPDYLLKDIGISRAQIGAPADPAAADLLRRAEGWR